MTERVEVESREDGALLRVVFEREGGNVLTGKLMRALDAVLAERDGDPRLKLVTIEGRGKHFSFGASVEEHLPDRAAEMLATFHALVRRLVRYPVPTAAVVRGRCLGGAFELALACRFVFAHETAMFACPEIKLGVLPPVLAALGPGRLGHTHTERLLLTGQDLSAAEAHAIGLVTGLAPEGADPLDAATGWYRQRLAPLSAYSLRQALAATRIGQGEDAALERLAHVEELYLSRLLPSHDGNEGIRAFLAKEAPSWTDS